MGPKPQRGADDQGYRLKRGCLQRGDNAGVLMAFHVGVKHIRGRLRLPREPQEDGDDAHLVTVQDHLGYDIIERVDRQVALRLARSSQARRLGPMGEPGQSPRRGPAWDSDWAGRSTW